MSSALKTNCLPDELKSKYSQSPSGFPVISSKSIDLHSIHKSPLSVNVGKTLVTWDSEEIDTESDELWAEGQALIAESLEADLIEE